MENDKINNKILDIKKKYPSKFSKIHPILYPKFKKNGILYIGLNPSNSQVKWMSKLDMDNLFYLNNTDYNSIINFEKKALTDYNPYFCKFRKINEEVKLVYDHIDLFIFKRTDQTHAKKILELKELEDTITLNEFGKEQLRLAKDIIQNINPQIIVVVNALASDIINKSGYFEIDVTNYAKLGYHYLILNRKIPILFSSMLTGQRALDNYSFDRLIWMIKKAIRDNNV